MKELKTLILSFLFERDGYLNYYQIERKLKNNNNHKLILELCNGLVELLTEKFIIQDNRKEYFLQ
ncbi:hypothetical protein SAMN04487765_1620 [Tenacibaculum sp. MAR_2010_89]|uniref:hypothetical protein n=1 Tax=Tenacibaculum sp. MAR_2010_89 TaxID=1250198 RepID=UPI000898F815|nr:hypothetical protein [Tenacibaculum sp. MAR_2010_89]SEE16577.1 hypothetical protein SAMN04487765_1620 [Tenacibaculum sp. MAR_2010_89]